MCLIKLAAELVVGAALGQTLRRAPRISSNAQAGYGDAIEMCRPNQCVCNLLPSAGGGVAGQGVSGGAGGLCPEDG